MGGFTTVVTPDRIGNVARLLDLILGARWDAAGDLGTDIAALIASNPVIMAAGTFTTSSATVPADTGRTEAINRWNGCTIIPLTGDVAFQPRIIGTFTNATGVFTLETPFTAVPGLVTYVIVPTNRGSRTDYKDIWCTDDLKLNNVTITTAGADKNFPNVVVAAQSAARGLPLGAIPTEAYLLVMFDLLDTSAAANYIKTAGDMLRAKISTGAWNVDDVEAWRSVVGDWYTPASGMSSQVIIGTINIASILTATGVGTYNICTLETDRALGLESQGATLAFKNLRTGLRIHYRMP